MTTEMTIPDIERLEALAEKAALAPGWHKNIRDRDSGVTLDDAAFIAACDPQRILALCALARRGLQHAVVHGVAVDGLLPCPFCGMQPVFDDPRDGNPIGAVCPEGSPCRGSRLFVCFDTDSREKAIEAWNTRAASPNMSQQVAPAGVVVSDEMVVAALKRYYWKYYADVDGNLHSEMRAALEAALAAAPWGEEK